MMVDVHIFTTGGSIDKSYSTQDSAFIVGPPQIETILREANVNLSFVITPLLRKDSLDITPQDRERIVEQVAQSSVDKIIITHGTDTMTQTAQALTAIRAKTIVLTGAMQPAAFKKSDAALNIGLALAAVQLLPSGVYIAMSGRVFPHNKTRKNPRTNQFETPENI